MKKIFVSILIFLILLLNSCVGKTSIKVENILENNDFFYNEEYGIEVNKKYDTCYSVGFITYDNMTIDVFVMLDSSLLKADFYNLANIKNDLASKEECFNYLDSEESKDNIILSSNIASENNLLILSRFEGDYYKNVDQIMLNIR